MTRLHASCVKSQSWEEITDPILVAMERALIEEARQRQRRRRARVGWVLLAIFVVMSLVVVGAGRGGTAPRAGSSRTSPPSRTAATVLQPCALSAMTVTVSSGVGLGHVAYRLEFRNVSARGCSLTGYPVVTAPLVWASGEGLPTNARIVDQMIGYSGEIYGLTNRLKVYERHLPVVALKSHGGVASVVVEYGDLIRRSCPSFTEVKLTLPHASPTTEWPLPMFGTLCTRVLLVHPIVPGATGFLDAQ